MKVKNWIIVALIGALTLSLVTIVTAQDSTTANVEVRVWQRISDDSLYLSTRPEAGTWTTHNEALDMSEISSSGRFRQSSFVTVAVPIDLPDQSAASAVNPEVCEAFVRVVRSWSGWENASVGVNDCAYNEWTIDGRLFRYRALGSAMYLSRDGWQRWAFEMYFLPDLSSYSLGNWFLRDDSPLE